MTTKRLIFTQYSLRYVPKWPERVRRLELPLDQIQSVARDHPLRRWGGYPGCPRFKVATKDGRVYTFQTPIAALWLAEFDNLHVPS